ncbi:Indigoidine synthase A like protein-domain-containing protein [Jimgerdemannia flammicorona]|uniref:Indigoidine synthase A like protein-domain-containing protein n=1 Tax=Jimgerdemannia flammicorona TaxID=994334 RepID=A0A433QFF9_9FUNG|nr:Indigoidine synthase A like protein-domain-containing protein [Jimgerdemannia flammicorona]
MLPLLRTPFASRSLHSFTLTRGIPIPPVNLNLNPEVKAALKRNQPVVALESTIISHGMPYPQNAEMALSVERIVRDNGAVPATIALLDGQVRVGLSSKALERLAKLGPEAMKTSRRDLAYVMSQVNDRSA